MSSQASEAAKRAGSQRNPKRKGGHLSPWTQLTQSLWPKMLSGAAGRSCSVAKVQRNSLTHFKASSHFVEAHKSPAEGAGELSQRLLLGLKSFQTIPVAKATNRARCPFQLLQLSTFFCQPFLYFIKVITKQNLKNPTTLGLISKSCPSLQV